MKYSIDLTGKSAIVTGAATGIGRAIAMGLAECGADVMICDMNEAGAQETAAAIQAMGRKSLAFKMDVTSEDDAAAMAKTANDNFGKIDFMYNNAGTISMSTIENLSLAAWEKIFAVNCRGVFLCSGAVIPYMKKAGGGRIINTASQCGKTGANLLTHYCATKAAVIGFTKGLALELCKDNIRVNCFCPGSVMTDMTRRESVWASEIQGRDPKVILDEWESAIPLGHYADPVEIANVAVFLATDLSDYMTGQAVNVTGGQEMH